MTNSNQVFETTVDGAKILYHTVLNKSLPANASKEDRRINLFSSGQEKDAIYSRLLTRNKYIKFFVVSTWACSLRCKYCFVLKQLKNRDSSVLSKDKIQQFIDRYISHYKDTEEIMVHFLGGEPLLNLDNCLAVIDASQEMCDKYGLKLRSTITTNGTTEPTDAQIAFLKRMDSISISIDGDQENHNYFRKVHLPSVLGEDDPFTKALKVTKKLCEEGLSDKLGINTTLTDKMFWEDERIKEFVFILTCMGVKKSKIQIALAVPTQHYETSDSYREYLGSGFVMPRPCCVFQYMSFFCLYDDKLYGNYYETDESCLGDMNICMTELEENYRKYVFSKMPSLHDETCMSCPVIGYCWGGCNHSEVLKNKPSLSCNQKALIDKVTKSAEEGTLLDFGEKHKVDHGLLKHV